MNAPMTREWDRTLKPRWMIERDAALDARWVEAGTYQFICKKCRIRVSVDLPATKRPRVKAKCSKCKRINIL